MSRILTTERKKRPCAQTLSAHITHFPRFQRLRPYPSAIDLWLIKLNGDGTVNWEKAYGGSSGEGGSEPTDRQSVQQTSDGGFIVAGTTQSFGANLSYWNLWAFKTDASGVVPFNPTSGASTTVTSGTVTSTTSPPVATTATVTDVTFSVVAVSATVTTSNAIVQDQAP